MRAELHGRIVRTTCPGCGGAVTNYQEVQGATVARPGPIRCVDVLMRCLACGRGGLAEILLDGGGHWKVLARFFPRVRDYAPLPSVPEGIKADFREAELCASVEAWRGAVALLRSSLEKTLAANGYDKGSLFERINDAATDGLITASRKERAHEKVRILGNDVLHDEWQEVTEDQYSRAHHYVQRTLEDFYEHREEVVKQLLKLSRIELPAGTDEGGE